MFPSTPSARHAPSLRVCCPGPAWRAFLAAALLLLSGACRSGGQDRSANVPDSPATGPTADQVAAAEKSIRDEDLARRVQELSADRMQGRLPGTVGEERATAYIESAFKDAGLRPANGLSYFQAVPLVGITADPSMSLAISGHGGKKALAYRKDFMAVTTREQKAIRASGEMVFVGYGTTAPEFGWDDYKGVDLTGKILVMLVNDPPLPDASRFGGKRMTYYGRWTYKYETGARKKAAGVILVHQTEAAGYPWGVVASSWSGEQFVPARSDHGASRLPFESWITHQAAAELFRMAGMDLAEQERRAASDTFRPLPLGLEASLSFTNTIRRIQSRNVAGLLPGSDLADQWIVYTAHWDHLGVSDPVDGDAIYNGAFDNATGVSSLVALAKAFASLPVPPRRSILFLAVTAEEQGLIGSYHYADHPLHPLSRTVALINMDGMNVYGRTKDVIVIGLGNTTLDDLITEIAARSGRHVTPDMEPEKGFYYRSDQFPFAKQGVPALYIDHGIEYVGRPDGWGMEQNARYTAERYHKPSDEFDPAWDFGGMAEDTRLLFRVGARVAQDDAIPQWKPGTEFKAVREQSLAGDAGR
ncbi:MAG: M28 family metallopeptidase [Acidobacteriota bacterium]